MHCNFGRSCSPRMHHMPADMLARSSPVCQATQPSTTTVPAKPPQGCLLLSLFPRHSHSRPLSSLRCSAQLRAPVVVVHTPCLCLLSVLLLHLLLPAVSSSRERKKRRARAAKKKKKPHRFFSPSPPRFLPFLPPSRDPFSRRGLPNPTRLTQCGRRKRRGEGGEGKKKGKWGWQ